MVVISVDWIYKNSFFMCIMANMLKYSPAKIFSQMGVTIFCCPYKMDPYFYIWHHLFLFIKLKPYNIIHPFLGIKSFDIIFPTFGDKIFNWCIISPRDESRDWSTWKHNCAFLRLSGIDFNQAFTPIYLNITRKIS